MANRQVAMEMGSHYVQRVHNAEGHRKCKKRFKLVNVPEGREGAVQEWTQKVTEGSAQGTPVRRHGEHYRCRKHQQEESALAQVPTG